MLPDRLPIIWKAILLIPKHVFTMKRLIVASRKTRTRPLTHLALRPITVTRKAVQKMNIMRRKRASISFIRPVNGVKTHFVSLPFYSVFYWLWIYWMSSSTINNAFHCTTIGQQYRATPALQSTIFLSQPCHRHIIKLNIKVLCCNQTICLLHNLK